MRGAEILNEASMPEYSRALLSTESRKTCINLARAINQSYDALYRSFQNSMKQQ